MNIEFEKQKDNYFNRMCGAASLSMVYKSLGIKTTQEEIWEATKTPDSRGKMYATCVNLCKDALNRGLNAIILMAKDPIEVLKICKVNDFRVIMNHRPKLTSTAGHFTVFVDLGFEKVIYHDPESGPDKKTSFKKMLELWIPNSSKSEITGNIVIVISDKSTTTYKCQSCQTEFPKSIYCPECCKEVPLEPLSVLGCINNTCDKKTWEYIFCPFCDCGITI